MKKLISLFCIVCFMIQLKAQDPVKLDLLKAPSSPAANLLGFASSDIDRPTDISAFMVSLQSATNSYTALPSNYAVDIAPFLVSGVKKSDLTTTGLQSTDFGKVFKQTFVLSAATRNPDSTEKAFDSRNAYAGLGFKFSILRGRYDDETKKSLKEISDLQDLMLNHLEESAKKWRKKNDLQYLLLLEKQKQMARGYTDAHTLDSIKNSKPYTDIEEEISNRLENFTEEDLKEEKQSLNDRIKKIAANFQVNRIGWSWDINAGISASFRDKKLNNSSVYNAGFWQTFGYTGKKGSSFLGLIRFLYNPDKIFALNDSTNLFDNISTLDGGFRYVYSKPTSKFSGSVEAIYRSVLSSNTIDPSWRLVANVDYTIFENQKLSFTFGRNFDGTITKNNNLVAALTLLTGFGNKR